MRSALSLFRARAHKSHGLFLFHVLLFPADLRVVQRCSINSDRVGDVRAWSSRHERCSCHADRDCAEQSRDTSDRIAFKLWRWGPPAAIARCFRFTWFSGWIRSKFWSWLCTTTVFVTCWLRAIRSPVPSPSTRSTSPARASPRPSAASGAAVRHGFPLSTYTPSSAVRRKSELTSHHCNHIQKHSYPQTHQLITSITPYHHAFSAFLRFLS